ncbi:MAG: hypothetical protein RLP44_11655 [Aggregatilineales bacterium]
MNRGRLSGIILMVIGFGVAALSGLWLAVQARGDNLSAGGALLGALIVFVPVALLLGFGIYLYTQGGQEIEEESTMRMQRDLLDILKSRGQVRTEEMAIELGVPMNMVQDLVHQLVGLQVFSGYVNWKEGMLYSEDASKLRELDRCKHCGGEIELVGKGVVLCPFCGTEYFLT